MTHQSEKLNLWDRIFNRYRKEVVDRGTISLYSGDDTSRLPIKIKHWVEYRIIDRLTGSETLRRERLD